MPNGIQEEALRTLVEGGAVRDTLVSRQEDQWTLAIRLGGLTAAGWQYVRAAKRCVPGPA
jgi:hypothetical protein